MVTREGYDSKNSAEWLKEEGVRYRGLAKSTAPLSGTVAARRRRNTTRSCARGWLYKVLACRLRFGYHKEG